MTSRTDSENVRLSEPERLAGTILEPDQVVPAVRLRAHPSGGTVTLADFRQRRALVLCLLHTECAECHSFAANLATREAELRQADALIRAILPAVDDVPLPLWIDADGQARQRLLGPDGRLPTIIVLDRYAAASEAYPAPGHAFPDTDEIMAAVRYLAFLCPECGT